MINDLRKNIILLLGQGIYANTLRKYIEVNLPHSRLLVCSKGAQRESTANAEFIRLPEGQEIEAIDNYCAARNASIQAVINRVDHYINLHGRLVDHFGVAGPSYKAVSQFTNKMSLHNFMLEHGLEQHRPKTLFSSVEKLKDDLEKCTFPVILKPFTGAKSRGVLFLSDEKEYEGMTDVLSKHFKEEFALKLQSNKEHTILVEEAVQGRQITPTSYIDKEGRYHFLSLENIITARDIGQKHMQLVFRTAPAEADEQLMSRINEMMMKVIGASGLRSTCLLPDLIISNNEVYLIELNVRVGGFRADLMKLAYDFDLDKFSLQLALGESVDHELLLKDHTPASATACEVWKEESGTIESINLPESPFLATSQVHFNEGDFYTAPPVGNKPLATFFVKHPTDSLTIARQIEAGTVVKYTDNAGPIV